MAVSDRGQGKTTWINPNGINMTADSGDATVYDTDTFKTNVTTTR